MAIRSGVCARELISARRQPHDLDRFVVTIYVRTRFSTPQEHLHQECLLPAGPKIVHLLSSVIISAHFLDIFSLHSGFCYTRRTKEPRSLVRNVRRHVHKSGIDRPRSACAFSSGTRSTGSSFRSRTSSSTRLGELVDRRHCLGCWCYSCLVAPSVFLSRMRTVAGQVLFLDEPHGTTV